MEIASRTKKEEMDKKEHPYFFPIYQQLFQSIRCENFTLVEFGIGGYRDPEKGGGSLKMWNRFFPHANIVGKLYNTLGSAELQYSP